MLDEAWVFLDDPAFASRIREWLKTLRKRNVSVIFATQSLADVQSSGIAPAIIESCASRIFLPNPQATEPQLRATYAGFGLNDRQIAIIAHAQPKRDYYYQSRLGNRLFDLDLGPVALAFAATGTPEDQRAIDKVWRESDPAHFPQAWLRHRGLDWAAELVATSVQPSGEAAMKRQRSSLVAAALLISASARAQLAVIDPANLVQNSLTAARTLQEVNNQLKQLANEATMLINDARNLATLPFNIVWQLKQTLALTNQLIAQAQGIGFQMSQTNVQFARFYPPSYASGVTGLSMAADSYQRWLHSLQALNTTVSMQSQAAQNLASDEYSLAALVSESQGAIGIVQAAQATNQLLALHARQSIQEQQLRLTQDRSAAIEQRAYGRRGGARSRSAPALRRNGCRVHAATHQLLRLLERRLAMNDLGVIDRFLDVFSLYIDSGFGLLKPEVAFLTATLIVIDITLAGLYWAMGGNEDVIARLVKKTLYIGTFAFILTNFNALASILFRSFAGLGLLASGSKVSPTDFLHPGRLAAIGVDAGAADPYPDRRARRLSGRLSQHRHHRRALHRVARGDRELLHSRDPALRHADRVQAHHPRRVRARPLCALESNRLSGRACSGQRRIRWREGARAGGHRRHRRRHLHELPVGRWARSRQSTRRLPSCWRRSR